MEWNTNVNNGKFCGFKGQDKERFARQNNIYFGNSKMNNIDRLQKEYALKKKNKK